MLLLLYRSTPRDIESQRDIPQLFPNRAPPLRCSNADSWQSGQPRLLVLSRASPTRRLKLMRRPIGQSSGCERRRQARRRLSRTSSSQVPRVRGQRRLNIPGARVVSKAPPGLWWCAKIAVSVVIRRLTRQRSVLT